MTLLPVSNPILSSILLQYPLPDASVLDTIKSGKRNDNFVVGDGSGHRFILRRYRRNNQETRVRFQLYFQQHLDNSGFPTSKIVRTISNDVLVVKEGTPWALFTFVRSTEYDFGRVKQVIEAARRLAQFHTAADSFQHQEIVTNISQMPN